MNCRMSIRRGVRRLGGYPTRQASLESLELRQLLAGDVVLAADTFATRQNGSAITLNVLANDQFSANYTGARLISAVSYGSEGGFIELADDRRTVRYQPPADFSGSETFSYFVDGQFFTQVNVNVESPLRPDSFRQNATGLWTRLDVLANDPFWTGYAGAKQITSLSVVAGDGEVRLTADGRAVEYRSGLDSFGAERFIYIVDGKYPANVVVDIAPSVQSDNYEIVQNTIATKLDVLANDPFKSWYQGEGRITHVNGSTLGSSISIAPDGKSLQYTPAAGKSGYDAFEYAVDGHFTVNVSVQVMRPVQDDYAEVDLNSTNFAISVLDNDQYWSPMANRMVDVVSRVTSASGSEKGGTVSVSVDGKSVLYTPPVGYFGTDTFSYLADGLHSATVTVQVTRPVRDDYVAAVQDTPNYRLEVLSNDFLGNGYTGARQITGVSATQQQALVTVSGSSLLYTPPAGYTGGDSLTYTIDNQFQATVQVNVQPLAQADWYNFCAAAGQSYTLPVLSNDLFTDQYTGAARITRVDGQAGGPQVLISADGKSLSLRPQSDGAISFRYVVDGKYEAPVNIYLQGHLLSDQFVADQNAVGTPFLPLANDFQNPDWWTGSCASSAYTGPRRITAASPSKNGGSVEVAADGKSVRYSPPADFYGRDEFTYTVDGFMQATASVQVVRRVLDDEVRVAANTAETLHVLANDLFGADYRGSQRITHVTGSSAGATVTIADDGKSLLYQPAAGFSGSDTLTYTVDGKLKATVNVVVKANDAAAFPQFESLETFQEFLIEDALKRYGNLFGTERGWNWWLGGENAAADGLGGVAPVPRDHSETNVQVAGVDEGDIVEFDSDYIYSLTGNQIVILKAWPAEELSVVSRTTIDGTPIAEFLNGDRLTILSTHYQYDPTLQLPDGGPRPVAGDMLVDDLMPVPYQRTDSKTIVTVLDVSDRAAPKLVQKTVLEGNYVQSRAMGDYVYLALSNNAEPPAPILKMDPIPDDVKDKPWRWPRGVYETRDEYLARVRANMGAFVDQSLPNYSSYGPDGSLVRTGLLHEPEDIYRPLQDQVQSLISLVSLKVTQDEPGLTETSGVYTSGAEQVYASLEHFYLFENGAQDEIGQVTRILQFDWNRETGAVEFQAKGVVPGRMLNQFSADEHEGHLRIVTTVSHSYTGNWTGSTENDLFVLREQGGLLEFVGAMKNLAVGEQAQSVRFLGDRAFLVTFRQVDPLFALDVSDPTKPTLLGHVTLPGFSSYIQPIGSDYLLTVGVNTPAGIAGPTQVSLFDVRDLTQPVLVDEYTFDRFSSSEAQYDHHAFGYFANHGLLAIPSTRQYTQRVDQDGDGYAETRQWRTEYEQMVLRVDPTASPGSNLALQLVGEIAHDTAVRRSGFIGDNLYSVAADSVHVSKVSAPATIVATVSGLKPADGPVDWVQPVWGDTLQQFLSSARTDLSGRLQSEIGFAVPVTIEVDAGKYETVLRAGEIYYRYESQNGQLVLVDEQFEFADGTIGGQNPDNPLDVNNDGQVAPNDALRIINALNDGRVGQLGSAQVVRQIGDGPVRDYWDTSGDGMVSPLDVLLIVNRLNDDHPGLIDTGNLSVDDPEPWSDAAAVDELFEQVEGLVGDSNLDGTFSSSDLVLIFQAGRYESSSNARWEEGDWNGDGKFSSSDLVMAFAQGRYRP